MTSEAVSVGLATVLAGIGIWLMLPRGRRPGRFVGMICALAGMGLIGAQLPRVAGAGGHAVFLTLALVTVVSCAATVTVPNPVYAAIWFGLVLMGTAGLFLFQGAQFLGVATIVVYAGAILVTLLFVLMLANPKGHAAYDRVSWEALLSAATGAAMVGMLTMSIVIVLDGAGQETGAELLAAAPVELEKGVLAEAHVAHLGAELFSRHLLAVEVAGALLLAALVGAVAIVAHGTPGETVPPGSTGEEG